MSRSVIFPGSFDPFTRGHEAVVNSALNLFDKVIIGIGVNSNKKYLFTVEQRKGIIESIFKDKLERLEVVFYEGLTVDYCKKNNIQYIVRGIRNTRDWLFENEIASMNKTLNEDIETIFLASKPEHSAINSTIVREIYGNGGDVSKFIPEGCKLP